jgi:hypothetical protein
METEQMLPGTGVICTWPSRRIVVIPEKKDFTLHLLEVYFFIITRFSSQATTGSQNAFQKHCSGSGRI